MSPLLESPAHKPIKELGIYATEVYPKKINLMLFYI